MINIIDSSTKKFSMDSLNINSKILYTNAKNFGIDLVALYRSSAKLIAENLISKYGSNLNYSIICGLGGNGGDGFALAEELVNNSVKATVYLVGRSNNIEDPVAFDLWNSLKRNKSELLTLKQDVYAENIVSTDVVIECLVGTGFTGDKLNKRFNDVIKRVSHFKKTTIAMDIAAPSYKPDKTISLIYPKTNDAEVININLPRELTMYPGPGEIEVLFKPKKHSYKVKNGRLVYISQSTENLERLVKYASDYYVHINVFLLCENNLKFDKEFVTILKDEDLEENILAADVIFLDDFNTDSILSKGLVNEVLKYSDKKFVLSQSSLSFINAESLKTLEQKLFILDKTNHEIFNTNAKGEKGYKRISVEYKSNLIIPSVQSYLYSDTGEFRLDISGKVFNKDFQKELLTLSAIFATKNDIWLSLRAADFMLVSI